MITMYDSIDVSTVPANPQAVAGYVGGHWPTFNSLVQKFPHALHLSIAVASNETARCLDVEPGDATNTTAVNWYHNHADRSKGKPVFYTSASNAQALINTLAVNGIPRNQYWLWSAHYTHEHICSPHTCGFPQADGTQWTSKALGRSLDQSLINDYVFIDPPKPKPTPKPNANPKGTAHFTGSFDTGNGHWTIKGVSGDFEPGTKGRTAAAYVTFDEQNGRWTIAPRPWAKGPVGNFFSRLFKKS